MVFHINSNKYTMKSFKYIIIILLSLLFISCRNDTSENLANGNKITPPSWIKGTWKLNVDYNQYYIFKNDDIVIQTAGMSTNFKTLADLGAYSQTSSDSEFTFSINSSNVVQTYKFKKISSSKIIFDFGLGGDYLGELFKQ